MKAKHLNYFLCVFLLASISLNVFLFKRNAEWESANIRQAETTFTVEMLLKESDLDLTYESIFSSAVNTFGDLVQETEVLDIHIDSGHDKRAIGIGDALLVFKDGKFYGSLVHRPKPLTR